MKYPFINEILSDPRCFEGRMVLVVSMNGKLRGYISQDGNKLAEIMDGKDIESVIRELEEKCKQIIGE